MEMFQYSVRRIKKIVYFNFLFEKKVENVFEKRKKNLHILNKNRRNFGSTQYFHSFCTRYYEFVKVLDISEIFW